MVISFIVNHIYINGGWSPWDTRIGGSEEMIVETSKRLAQQGHKVKVFHNGRHGNYEGVDYREHDEYEPGDITINVNFPEFRSEGKQILWTSLTDHPDLSKFEAVCCISNYARDNTHINHKKVFKVPPGYDSDKIVAGEKIPKQCFYASSPDRGLDTLLQAWPDVYDEHPDATLLLTYGATPSLPGVISMGEVDEETMNEIYKTSDVWCHPASGGELYCMTGVKAQVAKCVPVVIPTMALSETVRWGAFAKSKKDYADKLIKTLHHSSEIRKKSPNYYYPTWEYTVDKLMEVVKSVL